VIACHGCAGLGEVAPDARVTHRSGYRPRPWETRVGEIELMIPRTRAAVISPRFLEPRRRSEQGITAVVMEAYVNGSRLTPATGSPGMQNPCSIRTSIHGGNARALGKPMRSLVVEDEMLLGLSGRRASD
jgi:hypothetical protein